MYLGNSRSLDGRALQICTDRQWTSVPLLEISQRGIQIENADVTDDQPSNACFLREAADNVGRGMQRVEIRAGPDTQMHDQNIRALREIDELRVGSHLIRAEDERHIPDLHAVGKRR